MKLEPIAQILEEAGVGIRQQSIFINTIPQGLEGLLLRDAFGGTDVDHYLPGYIKSKFMVVARGVGYEKMDTTMKACVAALNSRTNSGRTIGTVTFKYIRVRTLPFSFQPSPGQNVEIAINVECCYVDSDFQEAR